MHLLFIGGTGNISTACADLLFKCGHQISVITRGRSAVPKGYQAVIADRKNLDAMREALSGVRPDVVLNFIGYELAEVMADYELFKGQVQQYIFISSATVYAKPPPSLPIHERSPMGNPFWEYAQKKFACEQWLRQQWIDQAFPVTIVRPSHTYSERWIPNPLSSSSYTFAARLEQGKPVYVPDDGNSPWTLTAASDFAVGLAGLVGNQEAFGEDFHITSDEVLTWNEIVREIATALGAPKPEIVGVPTDFICDVAPQMTGTLKGDKSHPAVFDNSKIKRFVGQFACRKPFRTGVRESIAWLRAHPDQQNLNPQLDALCDLVVTRWKAKSNMDRPAVHG
jgi:nucleoside-diphosphate-sugar epimerase